MKILTNKKYKKLVKDIEELRSQYGSVERETYGCLFEIPCEGFIKRKEM